MITIINRPDSITIDCKKKKLLIAVKRSLKSIGLKSCKIRYNQNNIIVLKRTTTPTISAYSIMGRLIQINNINRIQLQHYF